MSRSAARVSRLEHAQEEHAQEEEQARKPGRPGWWELPEDRWHLGTVGFSHEEALAELDATEPDAEEAGGA